MKGWAYSDDRNDVRGKAACWLLRSRSEPAFEKESQSFRESQLLSPGRLPGHCCRVGPQLWLP